MKKTITLTVIVFLVLSLLSFAGEVEKQLKKKGIYGAELTDPDKINLQVNKLQQAIQQQWIGEIIKMLAGNYAETDPTIGQSSIKERLDGLFSTFSEVRGVSTQTNAQTGWKVTATQNFYIQNVKINVQQDKAIAECEVGFYSSGKDYKNIKESLSFVLKEHRWLLAGSKNLFGFLAQASTATKREIGTPELLGGVIMSGTKDDFTSTHMLVPINLFVYDGTPIPRFNKTESLQWFWQFFPPYGWYPVNVMNYPYGIVADVQYTPGGPDFTYEFLFVTDVTADKILAAEEGKWVTDYGTHGSGDEGQFYGPRGICSWGGSGGGGLYLVADMFNNRVVAYYLEKTYDDPIWEFTLTHNFDWPIDVETKSVDKTQQPPQEVEYIAIVDHRNHRLVFFHGWPYGLGFDRSYGEYGSGEGQFIYPTSVCFGRDPESGWQTNDVFATDKGNNRLVRLYLQDAGLDTVFWRATYQFPADVELTSVEVDNKGLVYVVDRHNGKVYKFAPSSYSPYSFSLLGIWGEKGTADGQLYNPNVLTVAHGRYCPYPNPCAPFPSTDWYLGDVFVSESWGDETGVRRFVIAADVLNLSATYVPYNEDTGEGNFIWYTYHLTDFADNVTEQVFRGAELCTTYNRGSLNWGSQGGDWNVGGHQHGETYTVKITATAIYEPTVTVEKTVDVYVDTFTIHNPVITRGIRCNHENPLPFWCDDCYQCIKEGYTYTIDVQAFHPDGYSVSYKWSCGRGHFFDGTTWYQEITTSENYVCYVAPQLDRPPAPEFIKVLVKGPYGGEASTIVYPTIYNPETSCLCGDVNDDGSINSADIVCLINYLYKGGPAPDPLERADANNDCVVKGDDVAYLTNYLHKGGPPPECCWIH